MAPLKDTEETLVREEAHRLLTEYMLEHHQRKTPERYAILDAVYSFDGLFDVDQLFQRLEDRFRVSRASIYTTLDLLAQIGLVVRNQMPSKVYYERKPARNVENWNGSRTTAWGGSSRRCPSSVSTRPCTH